MSLLCWAEWTMQLNELKVYSGMPAGMMVRRSLIQNPDCSILSITTSACGRNVTIYNKVIRFVSCDTFTRRYFSTPDGQTR